MRRFLPRKSKFFLCVFLLGYFVSRPVNAQPVIGFTFFLSSDLSSPVDLANAGDQSNRLFIVQKGGIIRIFNGTILLPTPFLDITPLVVSDGERGLLSVAFHPDYETNRYFYIYYNNLSGDITLARYQAQAGNPNLADPASGVIMMTIPKPFSNHNGADLNFGPDGYLYFGTGDGGSGGDPNNNAQNGNSLLGKMIRIDVNDSISPPYYSIPPDNPYINDPNVNDHIWALGLRNPWRWSFDRHNNDVWIADVGQGALEEINFRIAGTSGGINYGWRCYEGSAPYNTAGCSPPASYVFPIFDYPHNMGTGGFSVTGGFVYRGVEYPALRGYYICADYVSGNVWLIYPNGAGGWTVRMQAGLPGSIVSFGEAEDGTLYAVSLGNIVYKVDVTGNLPVYLISFSGRAEVGHNELKWVTAGEQSIEKYIIEYSSDGINYQSAGEVTALYPNGGTYLFNHPVSVTGPLFYRLRIVELVGGDSYSPVISIGQVTPRKIKVYPTLINSGQLNINTGISIDRIDLYSVDGRQVFTKTLQGQNGYFLLSLPSLSRGIYYLQLQGQGWKQAEKIIIQ